MTSLFLKHLAHAEVGIPLDALGDRHQNGLRTQPGRYFFADVPDNEGRRCGHHQVRPLQAGKVAGDVQAVRESDAFQQRILPVLRHLGSLIRAVGPEICVVTVVAEDLAQGRAPAAAAYHHCFHGCSSYFL